MSDSLAKTISRLSVERQEEWLDALETGLKEELAKSPWWFVGRPEQQLPAGDWSIWIMKTGRAWGKTRSAAENFIDLVLETALTDDGSATEWAIIAETFSDCRKICVEGPSGIRRVLERRGYMEGIHYTYNRSQWQVIMKTGQIIHMLGAETADVGRGLNLSGLWADEIAKWPHAYATWTEGLFPALRIGKNPRAIVSTTPKPAHPLLKAWRLRTDSSVFTTVGHIDENRDNLSKAQLEEFHRLYDGTRIGRQEMAGEDLEDAPGALWTLATIEDHRVTTAPDMTRIVIAIDPATTNTEKSDETGIIAIGKGVDGKGYTLADRSCRLPIVKWAQRALDLFDELNADLIVGEKQGQGDFLETVLRQIRPGIPYKGIVATRGKILRAQPVSALAEQGRLCHVGYFPELEEQQLNYTGEPGSGSPDRLDAYVHGITALDIGVSGGGDRFLLDLVVKCGVCDAINPKEAPICMSCHEPLNG